MLEIDTNNPCLQRGCPAACCRNIIAHVVCRKERFLNVFPNAFLVKQQEELTQKVKDQVHGVYYFVDGGFIYFSVSGNCPNLNNNSCQIHGSRNYLPPCFNMIPGGSECERSKKIGYH